MVAGPARVTRPTGWPYDAGMTDIVDPDLEAYATAHTTAPPDHLEALAAELVVTLDSPPT